MQNALEKAALLQGYSDISEPLQVTAAENFHEIILWCV